MKHVLENSFGTPGLEVTISKTSNFAEIKNEEHCELSMIKQFYQNKSEYGRYSARITAVHLNFSNRPRYRGIIKY